MKMIRYNLAILASLMLAIPLAATAQKNFNPRAAVEAFDSTISVYNANKKMIEGLAEVICKKAEYHPQVMTGIARAFFHNYGYGYAQQGFKYLNQVLAQHPNYAPAYVLMGNLYTSDNLSARKTNGLSDGIGYRIKNEEGESLTDSAYYWYQKAIDVDPQNPVGYENYAISLAFEEQTKDPSERSVGRIESLLKKCAEHNNGYSVEWGMIKALETAGLYSFTPDYYARLDITTMSEEQLSNYAETAMSFGRWEDLEKVSNLLFEEDQDNPKYIRWSMLSCLQNGVTLYGHSENHADSTLAQEKLKRVDELWQRLKEVETNDNLNEVDYTRVAQSYRLRGLLNESAEIYSHLSSVDSLQSKHKNYLGHLVAIYRDLKKWDEAEQIHKRLISMAETDEEKIQRNFNYAFMYYQKGRQLGDDPDAKREAYITGNEILKKMYATLPVKTVSYYNDLRTIRLVMCWTPFLYYYNIEPNDQYKTSKGKTYAEQIIEVANDEYLTENDYRDIAYASHYLANYYMATQAFDRAKVYFDMILKYGEGYSIYAQAESALKNLRSNKQSSRRRR